MNEDLQKVILKEYRVRAVFAEYDQVKSQNDSLITKCFDFNKFKTYLQAYIDDYNICYQSYLKIHAGNEVERTLIKPYFFKSKLDNILSDDTKVQPIKPVESKPVIEKTQPFPSNVFIATRKTKEGKEYKYYEFQIKKNGKTTKRYFKTLDEAVKFRDEWFKENERR